MKELITSLAGWLLRRPSYMFLTADERSLADQPPGRFARAWWGLMVLSLGWGIGSAWLHGLSWGLFGDYTGLQLMPVAVVVPVMVLWLYRRAAAALAGAVCGSQAAERGTGVAVITVVLALALLGLPSAKPDWPANLPWFLHWIPRTMYRVLILAPLWGAWAMLIAPKFRRPTERTEPAAAELIRGCGPLTAAICMAVLLAATLFAFRMFGWWNLAVPAAAILSATAGGFVLCRRDGPTRQTLLAANLLTQIVVFLAYLALIRP